MCWLTRRNSNGWFEVGYYYPKYGGQSLKFEWYCCKTFEDSTMAEEFVHYLNGGDYGRKY